MTYIQRNKRRKVTQEYNLPHLCQLSLCSPLSGPSNHPSLPSNILHPIPYSFSSLPLPTLPSPPPYSLPSIPALKEGHSHIPINPMDSNILEYISLLFFGNKPEMLSSNELPSSLKDFTLFESFDSVSGISKGSLLPDIEYNHSL